MNLDKNKERFINLLSQVDRRGVEGLIEYLQTVDFFEAPASIKYHNCVKGGLCDHSLNVYDNLIKLNELYNCDFSSESMILAALLHDLAKIGIYEYYIYNKKIYGPSGQNRDDMGYFNWAQIGAWKMKDNIDKVRVCAEHGVQSFLIANEYIKLNEDETAAIINHHMDLDKTGIPRTDISEIYNRYPLASMLHIADLLATYYDENPYKIDLDE